ncbi:MAG: hypothetical protein JXL80_01485 [Planctomycetes bacterium]|nr:hypothetical protein [Planctomycetota bacterium]
MAGAICGKRWMPAIIGVTVLVAVGCSVSVQNHTSTVVGGNTKDACRLELADLVMEPELLAVSGTWAARGKWDRLWSDDSVIVEARSAATAGSPEFVFSRGLPADELQGVLPGYSPGPDKPTGFSIPRDGGTFQFAADPEGKPWKGSLRLKLDPAYAAQMSSLLAGELRPVHWVVLVLDNVRADDVRRYRELGISVIVEDLLRMVAAGLEPEYIVALQDAGYAFTLDDLIRLRQNGITAEYAVAMRQVGYDLSAADLVRLRQNGIKADYAKDMKGAGYLLSVDDLIRLRQNGITAEYAGGMKDAGYDFQTGDLVRLRQNGITTEYAGGMRQAGYAFSIDDLIRLRQNGITTSYAGGMKKAGRTLSVGDLVRLRQNGITAEYVDGMSKAGYDFSLDDLIRLRQNGIKAEYAAALHSPDAPNLTADEIIELRRTGVKAETIRKIRGQK